MTRPDHIFLFEIDNVHGGKVPEVVCEISTNTEDKHGTTVIPKAEDEYGMDNVSTNTKSGH